MDDDILETVQSIFGKSVRIIDCEKTTSVHEEEILLINGVPVQLNGMTGDDTDAIKAALLTGQMPSVELLNQLLYQAGILQQSVQLETSLSVQSTMVTTEDVSVSRDGHIIDERSIETRENYTYKSNNKEIWQPQLQQNLQNTNKNRQNLESAEDIVTNEGNPTFINLICPEDKGYDHSSIKKGSLSTLHIDTIIDSNGFQTSSNDVVLVSDDHRLHRNLTTASAAMEPKGINPRTSLSLTTTILNKSSCPSESPMTSDTQVMKEPGLEKKSNISNASGHDDGCHSISYSATTAANSLPSNNDIVSKTFERKNASKLSSAQSNVGVQEKSDKNHVDFEFLIDKGQMLPISNNVNSGSGGCGNDSATINKPHSVKSNPIRSSNSTDFASFQHPNKGSRKCYQYIKPQTCLIQQQKEYVPVTSMEDMVQSTSNTKSDDLLVYCDGNLISGSLEALILHMVPTCNYYPDSIYIFSFLLSARLFIRPHELLCSISETWEEQNKYRCDVVDDSKADNFTISLASPGSPTIQRKTKQFPSDSDEYKNEFIQMTQDSAHNCIRLLAEWIETFPYDFRDERLMQQVRILARKCVYIDNALGKQVSKILQMLVQRLTVLEKYEEFLQSLTEAEVNSVDSQQTFYSGVTSVHNPLGRSTTTALATESFAIQKSSTTCSSIHLHPSSLATYCANTNANSSESFSHQNENSQHIHSFTDNSASSVNLNIHNLPGQLLNTSYQSVNDIHGIMDICSSPAQLAHQLTTVELERLSHIGPEEFVQAFAKDYNHTFASQPSSGAASSVLLKASFNDIKKTRNLESYVQWFNRLSYLTATEIVKYSKKKQRVRVIEYWIETARECFNIGNFNSLMAIIAGLNLSPISRLKKTWSKVQSAKFSVLEHQMDPSSNFNSYRSTLKAAMWRSEGATNECERIIIPFFSLFVKDLYFLNEGCSNRLPNNHINFEKCSQLSKQVMEFNEWKKVSCPFEKLPNVIKFLQSSVVLNENTLSIASFECEPPENTHEKGRYKTLKSETKQLAQLY